MELVLLFPGQGSQKPGMGKDLAAAYGAARDLFAEADTVLGEPLGALCFDGPADTLTLTHNAQPALFTHGAAVWAVLRDVAGARVRAAAGHSLGEFTAYHAAGSLDFAAGVALVRRRGALMYEAGTARPGAMAAILGDLARPAEELCAEASSASGEVVPANYNAPGQLVISGETAAVDRAMELAKAAGARRAVRLNVGGAFHSPLMQPAADGLADALDAADMRDPAFGVVSNVTTEVVRDAATARDLLRRQLTAPVRWTGSVQTLASGFPDALFVELGPGSVLTGLVKRIAPAVATATCGTAAEVDRLLQRLS